jgi:hypothetical protein
VFEFGLAFLVLITNLLEMWSMNLPLYKAVWMKNGLFICIPQFLLYPDVGNGPATSTYLIVHFW